MKVLALNLPGFHRIPENDKWWGEGFTEWDNVKRAKPLFPGHVQPQVPLNDNYYDLSKIENINWQAKTAKSFGVDGFVYYHYWFSGHKLFEQPIEKLRAAKNIDIEYCLCWANETWARTWEGNNKDILIQQNYGDISDWENHIEYLMNFFSDSRYIKIDNRPVLFIYSMNQYSKFDEMIKVWNKKLNENGFKDLYLIEFMRAKNNRPVSQFSSGLIEFEPMYTIRYDISFFRKVKRYLCKKLKRIDFQDYDKTWKRILHRKKKYGSTKIIYKSCFCSWDNSPRKGRNSIILKGSTPEKFGFYFYSLLKNKRPNSSNDLVIINAWNEWGEGAMLEPTKQDGYSYLEALKVARNRFEKGE